MIPNNFIKSFSIILLLVLLLIYTISLFFEIDPLTSIGCGILCSHIYFFLINDNRQNAKSEQFYDKVQRHIKFCCRSYKDKNPPFDQITISCSPAIMSILKKNENYIPKWGDKVRIDSIEFVIDKKLDGYEMVNNTRYAEEINNLEDFLE